MGLALCSSERDSETIKVRKATGNIKAEAWPLLFSCVWIALLLGQNTSMCCHILFWITFSSSQLLFYVCLCYLEAWKLLLKNASFYGIIANAKGRHLVWGIFLSPNQLIPKSIIVLIVFFLIGLSMIEWQALLNSPKLPWFPYDVHLFHFACGLLSCAYISFLIHLVFFSLPLMLSELPKILVTGILW